MPRYLPVALVAIAAVFARSEWRRVNADLDRVRRGKSVRVIPTLRRDETTGEWRPSR
jgi:hypothetical protein